MKAIELMNELFALAKSGEYQDTCDTCKAGDPEREVHHDEKVTIGNIREEIL